MDEDEAIRRLLKRDASGLILIPYPASDDQAVLRQFFHNPSHLTLQVDSVQTSVRYDLAAMKKGQAKLKKRGIEIEWSCPGRCGTEGGYSVQVRRMPVGITVEVAQARFDEFFQRRVEGPWILDRSALGGNSNSGRETGTRLFRQVPGELPRQLLTTRAVTFLSKERFMSNENRPTTQRGPRPIWFNALLLLDAFALGGLAVWRFMLTFLENAQTRFVTPSGEIFHVLDKLSPYWLGHIGVSLLLLLITAGGYLWLRTRSAVVSALIVIIPMALVVWFWISRTRSG